MQSDLGGYDLAGEKMLLVEDREAMYVDTTRRKSLFSPENSGSLRQYEPMNLDLPIERNFS